MFGAAPKRLRPPETRSGPRPRDRASPGTDIEGRRVAAPASRDGRDPNDSDDGADGPAALPAGDLRRFMGPLRHQAPERMLGLQACVRVRVGVSVGVGVTLSPSHSVYLSH